MGISRLPLDSHTLVERHPLLDLTEVPLQEIFSYLSPKDLAAVSLLKKNKYTSGIITTNEVWKEMAKKIECPIVRNEDGVLKPGIVRNQVKKYVLDLKQDIKSLNQTLPKDIAEIVNSTKVPTFEEILLLKDYRKARDTLVVWKQIGFAIQHLIPDNYETLDEMFEQVNGFTDWCKINQNSLNQILQLDLSYLNLTTLPNEIGQLTQLLGLKLNNNKLISLPPEIGNLTQLQVLILCNNNLTALPNEIGQLTQLQGLILDYNNLTTLPKEIGNLTQLEGLGLQNNKFTTLPKEIGNLTQMRWFELSDKKLISKEIINLTQLPTYSRFFISGVFRTSTLAKTAVIIGLLYATSATYTLVRSYFPF